MTEAMNSEAATRVEPGISSRRTNGMPGFDSNCVVRVQATPEKRWVSELESVAVRVHYG